MASTISRGKLEFGMKSFVKTLLCIVIMAAGLCSTKAQTASPASDDDLNVMVQLIEQATPIPSVNVPRLGTFWSAQHAPGTAIPWPPFPGNINGLDAWSLGDNVFLLNDTNVDYDELAVEYALAHPISPAPMFRFSMVAGSLASSYAYGNPVYLANMATSFTNDGSGTINASFSIAGGTNFVPYDILTTTNAAAPVPSWNWLGIGYTSNRYTFTGQPADHAFYILAKPAKTMTVGFGSDIVGQCDTPYGLTNALQVAGGAGHSVALLNNGTVVAWGWNNYGQATVPTNLTGAAMVGAGWYHSAALLTNGTVTTWGMNGPPYYQSSVPVNLTNATVISAQALHTLALTSNGLVAAWGYDSGFGESSIPAGLSNVVAISAGFEFNLAVTTNGNGTVVAWGDNEDGETNVPAGLSNVVDVAAGLYHSLALLKNGTVVAWGSDDDGETDVPAGLTNVVAIAAGGDPYYNGYYTAYSMALKSDGSLVIWGNNDAVATVGGLSNVISIGAGTDHALAIRTGPRTPVITSEPTDQFQTNNGTVIFSVIGQGLYGITYQWQTNGVNIAGATNAMLTVTNNGLARSFVYDAVVTDDGGMGSMVSTNANVYLVSPPVINAESIPTALIVMAQSNVTLTATASAPGQLNGFPISYQWQFNGTNIPWQTSTNYAFSAANSGIYSLIVSNAAGSTNVSWQVNVLYPGNVAEWGSVSDYLPTLTNAAAIAAGWGHVVAARDDGTVTAWGDNEYLQTNVPVGLSNVVTVAAGGLHSLALKNDGTLVGWGWDRYGQADSMGLSNVTAIAAAGDQSMALLKDGTVYCWGNTMGDLPGDLTNATAIAAGQDFCLALRSNGTVTAWGNDAQGQTNVPAGLSNVVAIAAGDSHALALKRDGTITAWGNDGSGQCDVPSGLTNVMAVAAGSAHSVALKNDGTMVCWGDNSQGQTSTPNLSSVKLIAAGGNQTLAAVFSPLVMYPVDVTRDLLLIYNTNSADSITVFNYYLANRPMVGSANVLGIGCTTNETFLPAEYTNVFVAQVQGWLAANPTKRPQYIVLFYDIPARVNTNNTTGVYPENISFNFDLGASPSVQYQLSTSCAAGWNPFVSSINMGGTNDCINYINKLAAISASFSPGKLVISANAGGYGNTNYCFDDAVAAYPSVPLGLYALQAVTSNGVPMSSVEYTPFTSSTPITSATNVAGYLTWGANGALGSQRSWYSTYFTNVFFYGKSSWYLISTVESFNGQRDQGGQGNFIKWFSSVAFGGTNYSCTPVGAVTHVDEPGLGGVEYTQIYFGLWAAGKNFAICAWNSRKTQYFQAVGDPFTIK